MLSYSATGMQYDLLCSQVDELPACLPARTEQNRKPITRVQFKVGVSALKRVLSYSKL